MILAPALASLAILGASDAATATSGGHLDCPIVVTQLPAKAASQPLSSYAGTLRASYGEGSRLLLIRPNGDLRLVVPGFHSACDPDVSFDSARAFFARMMKTTWVISSAAWAFPVFRSAAE